MNPFDRLTLIVCLVLSLAAVPIASIAAEADSTDFDKPILGDFYNKKGSNA